MIKRIVFCFVILFTSINMMHTSYAQDNKPAKTKKKEKKSDGTSNGAVIMDFSTPDTKGNDSPFPDVVQKGKL